MDNLSKKSSVANIQENYGERESPGFNLLSTLREVFRLEDFREGQSDIINTILSGKDSLAIMPTGGGKSLCYQLPAILLQGTTIVFSPLISLMKDQVDSLIKRNISASFLNSSLSEDIHKKRLSNFIEGKYKILFVAPERLNSKAFQSAIGKSVISFVVIDEAHCISEWGHNFRPMYLKIAEIFNYIRRVPLAAFTATATPEVRDDIVKYLRMDKPEIFIKGFNRSNLAFKVETTENKKDRILKLLKKYPNGSKIIYSGTRNNTLEYAELLNSERIPAIAYHGGLPANERKEIQEKFISNEINTIVATNAFGMGIDKPDVRLVIHVDLPMSLEAYYQEAGRAGRDGNESECYVLYSKNDEKLPSLFIFGAFPHIIELRRIIRGINNLVLANKKSKISGSIAHLAAMFNIESTKLKTIFKILKRKELIEFYDDSHLINLTVKDLTNQTEELVSHFHDLRIDVYNYLQNIQSYSKVNALDLNNLAMEFAVSFETLRIEIQSLESLGLIEKLEFNNFSGIIIKEQLLDEKIIDNLFEEVEERKSIQIRKADKMLDYLRADGCKQNFILKYFGENREDFNCGKCSFCTGEKFENAILNKAHIHNFKKEISRKATKNQEIIDKLIIFSKEAESMEILADHMKLTKPELANLMESAIENGWLINQVMFIHKAVYDEVRTILEQNSNFRLSQIRERLSANCDFPELRVVVAYVRKSKNI